VGAFVVDFLLDTADARVFDCAVATVDCGVLVLLRHTDTDVSMEIGHRGSIPLNRALFAIHMPPPTSISPPMPPKRPFGGPPPAPPNRALLLVSSPWMRAHASFGSGADMFAVCLGGMWVFGRMKGDC
jgi:hypothetical protein